MWGEVSVQGLAQLVAGVASGLGELCQLCGERSTRTLCLQEVVQLQRSYCPPAMTLAEILAALTQRQPLESETKDGALCPACARAATTSLIFLRLCNESERCLKKLCADMTQCLDTKRLASPKIESMYIFLGEDEPKSLVDKRTVPGTAAALRRAQVLLRNEQIRVGSVSTLDLSGGSRCGYFQCEDCGKIIKNKYRFKKHFRVHSQNLQCLHCEKVCTNLPRLKIHIARAHSKKKYECTFCDKKFGSEYLVAEHQKAMHHRDSCSICGKMYGSKSALRAHEQTHKEWTCNKCGKSYKYKQSLRNHICPMSEVSPKLFVCAECGRKYSAKTSLRTHIQLEHLGNPHTCTLCHKRFHSAGRLRDHAAVHTGLKGHTCPFCEGGFMTRATLSRHVRSAHTGEKPYRCWECGACFVSSHRRTEHRRMFHGAPAPTCHVCGARSATRHDLRRHLRKHLEPASKLYRPEVDVCEPAVCGLRIVDTVEM